MYKPEISLRKIVEIAFERRFHILDEPYAADLNREVAMVNYLVHYKYGYLIEDYIKKIGNKCV